MICPILTGMMMQVTGKHGEINPKVECYREECGMWPLCRRLDADRSPWIKDAVLTSIPKSEARGGED